MRKKILAIILALSFVLITLSGCSCMGKTKISLSNAFLGDEATSQSEAEPGYTETLIYNVSYDDTKYYAKDSFFNGYNLSFSFSGTYTSTLTALQTIDTEYFTDIAEQVVDKNGIYLKLSTELLLDSTYVIDGKNFSRRDSISTCAYFCPKTLYFAPIYSSTLSSYSILTFEDGKFSVSIQDSESNTKYSTDSYSTNTRSVSYGFKDETKKLAETDYLNKTYKYEYGTAIDNTQLLFALRGFNVVKEQNTTLSVVSPLYGEPTDLLVSNNSENEISFNIEYNGSKYDNEKISVKELTYCVNSTKTSGTEQYLYIQKSASVSGNIKNNALPLLYAEPLYCYSPTFNKLGALVFTLNKITINK